MTLLDIRRSLAVMPARRVANVARRNQLINTSATLTFGLVALFVLLFLLASGREDLTARTFIPAAIILSFVWQGGKDLGSLPDAHDEAKPVGWLRVVALYAGAAGAVVYLLIG